MAQGAGPGAAAQERRAGAAPRRPLECNDDPGWVGLFEFRVVHAADADDTFDLGQAGHEVQKRPFASDLHRQHHDAPGGPPRFDETGAMTATRPRVLVADEGAGLERLGALGGTLPFRRPVGRTPPRVVPASGSADLDPASRAPSADAHRTPTVSLAHRCTAVGHLCAVGATEQSAIRAGSYA